MTENDKKSLKLAVGAGATTGVGAGFLTSFDPVTLVNLLSQAAQNEIAQAGFFFALAAWIHSGRVKKEIAKNFTSLTEAINNVANTLRQDLERHGKRLDNLTDRVENLENHHKPGGK